MTLADLTAGDIAHLPDGTIARTADGKILRISDAAAPAPQAPTDRPITLGPQKGAPPRPVDAPQPHKHLVVDKRTWRGLQPWPARVPNSEADSLALRTAELKRRRKRARRLALLPTIGVADPR